MNKEIKEIEKTLRDYPEDVFISVSFRDGTDIYVTLDVLQNCLENSEPYKDYYSKARIPISDIKEIVKTFKSLKPEDLMPYDGSLDFLSDCFSFYKDFLEYVRTHKCYVAGPFYLTRDGATYYASYGFYVFV